jgi:hypothetical protein
MNESAVKEAPLREGALWPALHEYWHVVAWSDDVKEGAIFPFTLLDEDIVVCRLGGALAAFSDLCIHRGTPISLGYIERDRIVCCYHSNSRRSPHSEAGSPDPLSGSRAIWDDLGLFVRHAPDART